MSHDAWDATFRILTLVLSVTSTIVIALIGIAVKQIIGRANDNLHLTSQLLKAEIATVVRQLDAVQHELSDHKEDCGKINKAVLAEKVRSLEEEVQKTRKFSHWIGDCISAIAGKVGAVLPQRAE